MTPEVPAGARCFIDANILVYYFVQNPKYSIPSEDLIRRVEHGEITAFISSTVVAEVLHRVMLSEVQTRYQTAKPLAYVQRHPEIIADLQLYLVVPFAIKKLPFQFSDATLDLFSKAVEIAARESLLTDDATILALMKREGISYLVSNDDEFDHVAGITVCKPR